MANTTLIQSADSTCNPITGCEGCELWRSGRKSCYAGIQTEKFGRYRLGYSPSFNQIIFWPGRMAETAKLSNLRGHRRPDKPWLNGMSRVIFISDMGDSLCKAVPFEYLRMEVIDNVVSSDGRRHIWLWLTKRPERMAEFCNWLSAQGVSWPRNLWPGTSITRMETTPRIDDLLKVGNEQTVRYLSIEPQLERLDLSLWLPRIDWVAQGGESGVDPRAFDVAWAAEMHEQCKQAGTQYFLKQLGANVFSGKESICQHDSHGSDWSKWPSDVPKLRQMPQREVCLQA